MRGLFNDSAEVVPEHLLLTNGLVKLHDSSEITVFHEK